MEERRAAESFLEIFFARHSAEAAKDGQNSKTKLNHKSERRAVESNHQSRACGISFIGCVIPTSGMSSECRWRANAM